MKCNSGSGSWIGSTSTLLRKSAGSTATRPTASMLSQFAGFDLMGVK